jgi:hypothetical protein
MLVRHDIRIRHSNVVRVFTSGRTDGRTRFGLSRQLKDWQRSGNRLSQLRVESARFLNHLFTNRRQLRQWWLDYRATRETSPEVARHLAAALGLPVRHVVQMVQAARYFGALLQELSFYERSRAMWPDSVRLGSLPRVVNELRTAFQAERLDKKRLSEMLAVSTVQSS